MGAALGKTTAHLYEARPVVDRDLQPFFRLRPPSLDLPPDPQVQDVAAVLDLSQADQRDVAGAELEAIGNDPRLDLVVVEQLPLSPDLMVEPDHAILQEAQLLFALEHRRFSLGIL